MKALFEQLKDIDGFDKQIIDYLTRGIIMLGMIKSIEPDDEELHELVELLQIAATSSLSGFNQIYVMLFGVASLTRKGKYYALDTIETSFTIDNAIMYFKMELSDRQNPKTITKTK